MKKRENLSAVSLLTLFLILGSLSIWSGVAVAQVWNTEIVDSGKDVPDQYDVGMYNSIALDSSGILHISYGGNGYFRYATNGSDSWLINTISRRLVGYYTSLVIDSSGNSHISLYDHFTDSLKYATNSSGTWVIQTVDSDGNAGRL